MTGKTWPYAAKCGSLSKKRQPYGVPGCTHLTFDMCLNFSRGLGGQAMFKGSPKIAQQLAAVFTRTSEDYEEAPEPSPRCRGHSGIKAAGGFRSCAESSAMTRLMPKTWKDQLASSRTCFEGQWQIQSWGFEPSGPSCANPAMIWQVCALIALVCDPTHDRY